MFCQPPPARDTILPASWSRATEIAALARSSSRARFPAVCGARYFAGTGAI
jgi:hypothetical protein